VRPRGNIEQLASGSLRVRVYAGVDVLTGRDLYLKQTIPTGPHAQAQAERVRQELTAQVWEGRHPKTNASVQVLIERHLAVSTIERRGLETLQGYLRKHIVPLIGDRPIGSVNAEMLDSFYAQLRRCRDHCDGQPTTVHRTSAEHTCDRRCRRHQCRPLAAGTIRKIHYLLSGAYKDAIRWEWIAVNPMVRGRKPAQSPAKPQPPSAEEAAALVNESWRRGFGPFVWLAMTTGARRGELCGLRWGDLLVRHTDTARHECVAAGCQYTLVIERGLCQSGGELWESDTKTHQQRHIALDPETVAVLLEHRQDTERAAEQLGVTITNYHFMFAGSPEGTTPSKPTTVSQRYRRCAQSLGIRTTLKSLRHYSATELITAGVDIRTVAGRLGHGGGGTTTLKVYAAWVSAADQHASMALMNRMPPRPDPRLDPAEAARRTPRWPHERVAAGLYDAWQRGRLAAGSELTMNDIARDYEVSIGTAHRVITHLNQWGVLRVENGRRSVVRALDSSETATATTSAVTESAAPDPPDQSRPAPAPTSRQLLTLDLIHLGTRIRRVRAQANPDDFDTLQRLMLDAIRRTGADQSQLGDYEMAVHLDDTDKPITTVVIAA
jgi:integrase